MKNKKIFPLLGGVLPLLWGIAHLFPTRSVVRAFGAITLDNARIITMEWITEGVALIFIGLLIIVVTAVGEAGSKAVRAVYGLTFLALVALSVVSLFTGFRIDFLPFKLCPVIFMTSGLLILSGLVTKRTHG